MSRKPGRPCFVKGFVRRALLHILALPCFVLLIACAILWPRSHYIRDEYRWKSSGEEKATQYTLSSGQGRLQLLRIQSDVAHQRPPGLATTRQTELLSLTAKEPVDVHRRFAGVEYFHRPRHSIMRGDMTINYWGFTYVAVPYWLLMLLLAVMPIAWMISTRRRLRIRRRRKQGLCLSCGYDLRASSGRCPECGTDAGAN